jgi:hypothetical protein
MVRSRSMRVLCVAVAIAALLVVTAQAQQKDNPFVGFVFKYNGAQFVCVTPVGVGESSIARIFRSSGVSPRKYDVLSVVATMPDDASGSASWHCWLNEIEVTMNDGRVIRSVPSTDLLFSSGVDTDALSRWFPCSVEVYPGQRKVFWILLDGKLPTLDDAKNVIVKVLGGHVVIRRDNFWSVEQLERGEP